MEQSIRSTRGKARAVRHALVMRAGVLAVLAGSGLPAAAQQASSVLGRVVEVGTERPLSGVEVSIPQVGVTTITDAEGNFTIDDVPAGSYTLEVRLIGYAAVEREVAVRAGEATRVELELSESAIELDALVVTAMSVERQARSLGYSAQTVSTEDLAVNRPTNILNSLHGKVAGLEVTTSSGTIGSSTRIVLRGAKSLSGDNQPLIIVDGVYIDNSNFGAPQQFSNSADYGNAAMDLNPDDIESMNVLKGANAAALYGSRAANGAIVITTKDGSAADGVRFSLNSTMTFERPWILPDFQNEYGLGFNGEYSYMDGRGGGVNDAIDMSWGPPLDGRLLPQWWSDGEPVPWVAHPDNVRDFFELGSSISNNIAVAGNSGATNYRLSFTDVRQDGMFPNTSADRVNLQAQVGADASERLRLEARGTYINYAAHNMPDVGYAFPDNPVQSMFTFFGRQLDMERLREYKNPDGSPRNWNRLFFDNPYWVQYENTKRQERDRIVGGIDVDYDLAAWMGVNARVGIDRYDEMRSSRRAFGSFVDSDGEYEESVRAVEERSYNVMLRAARDFNTNLSIDARVGVERRERRYELNGASTAAMTVPDVYSLSNSAVPLVVQDYTSEKRINSAYGAATLNYRNYLFLDVTGRSDWSSTLPEGSNQYFYPSASLSYVFTDALGIGSDWLQYGKLRGGWTLVGNDTDPYQLQANYNPTDPIFGEIPGYTISTVIPNAQLKPERTRSWEVGTELAALDNRLTLDLTYYNSLTEDQILATPLSSASGYEFKIINAGAIKNEGIEVALGGTPVQTTDFEWNVHVNFTTNRNEVVELAPGVDSYLITDQHRDVTLEARPGEAFGSLYGPGFLRDEDGNIVVNDQGIPMTDNANIRNWGSYQADWQSSISTDVVWRDFRLSALADIKRGGVLSSETYMWGHVAGVLEETLEGRETPLVFDGGRWADGAVKQDGTPNDIPVLAQDFNQFYWGNAEAHIFDASYAKLRQLQLTYSFPRHLVSRVLPSAEALNLSLVANNVWMIHKNVPHIDPENSFSNNNVQGLESTAHPSARSFGINVNLVF